jgi:hypothetical protein
MARPLRVSEVRAEELLTELLKTQGWDTRRPPAGELLRQQEYRDYPHLLEILHGISKTGGKGDGRPEAFLVTRTSADLLGVIEAKPRVVELHQTVKEVTEIYGTACVRAGYKPLAVAVAGTSEDFKVQVFKWTSDGWRPITYDGNPINWIPNRTDMVRLIAGTSCELRPSVPPPDVLADRADQINRLLRESGIKDEFRPAVIGAIMLALWQSKGDIRKHPDHILGDINEACQKAFQKAKKGDLAKSIRVDEANEDLAGNAKRIVTILERLNVTALTAEHDYLGQLYEAFFRYTGGNTIGQYFTPRHIAEFMADFLEVDSQDITLDEACGTGGFLIAVMNRINRHERLSRAQVVSTVQKRLIGFDKEPITAALCVANMILRGDGSTGVHRGDCFTSDEFLAGKATVLLTNVPFPHAKTDTPPERFIARGLEGLQQRGRGGVIVPRSLLNKKDKDKWRASVLERNRLNAVVVLPDELFAPYASSCAAILFFTKGVPHCKNDAVFFARIENDGFRRRKNVRLSCEGEQLSPVLTAYRTRKTIAGLCGWAALEEEDWDAGAYIPTRTISESEISEEAGALVRAQAAFVVAHSTELAAMLSAVSGGDLKPLLYQHKDTSKSQHNTIGDFFYIGYGQKTLHSKERLTPGSSLVISSSGIDNGCYGFFDFDELIAPPFVTVPSTGSIGKAHVQKWPCGVTDDCLILLPKEGVTEELLFVAAAVIRRERWRFNYGRKITPKRIRDFPMPTGERIIAVVRARLNAAKKIETLALEDGKRFDEIDNESAKLTSSPP